MKTAEYGGIEPKVTNAARRMNERELRIAANAHRKDGHPEEIEKPHEDRLMILEDQSRSRLQRRHAVQC